MSESLKSWLFAHCASTASLALEGQYDLSDLPFQRGNRVQLLRFLTFRPPATPNSEHTDVWALVGDRTHCIAARFARDQVDRFHTTHPVALTALKGALVTLTNVRITVARVRVHTSTEGGGGGGVPYRDGQYALVLDVRGWDVVSSVHEPVWFGGVKLVTSPNAVPASCEAKANDMMRWMKSWIRYKNLLRRAKTHHNHTTASTSAVGGGEGEAEGEAEGEGGTGEVKIPTPAQRNRKVLVLSSSQAHNTQLPPPQPLRQADEEHGSQSAAQAEGPTSSALWDDFNLDAEVDVDDIELPAWGTTDDLVPPSSAPPTPAPVLLAPVPATIPAAAPIPPLSAEPRPPAQPQLQSQSSQLQPPPAEPVPSPSPLPTQSPSTSELDPYESGLSDYERETRLARHRARASATGRNDGNEQRAARSGGEASTTTPKAVQRSVAALSGSSKHPPPHTKTTSKDTRRVEPTPAVPSSTSGKKRKRQQALAALMAQIVD